MFGIFEIVAVIVVVWLIFGRSIKEKVQPALDKTDIDEKLVALLKGQDGEFAQRIAEIRRAISILKSATQCPECITKIDEVAEKITVETVKQ